MFQSRPTPPPNEFCLLVAIPLDRAEFEADAGRGTDFLRAYAANLPRFDGSLWDAYGRYADTCREIVDQVERFGVNVIRRACSDALASALARFRVVTLLAHARGPEIVAEDIVDPDAVAMRGDALRAAVGAPPPGVTDRSAIASTLDAALGPETAEDERAMNETRAYAWRTALYRARWHRRACVERICGEAIRGGPAIEFENGLVRIERLRDTIPQFRVFDLTVCDSVLLAECVREVWPSDGVILANPNLTYPDVRLAFYREAIQFATRHRLPYEQAVVRLRRLLKR
jgi:hypothetical protein